MENKSDRETERALLLKLRESVNSRQEFEWVEAQLARFSPATEAADGMASH